MNNTEGLLASYVLRLKDIPLVEFSLYVSYEEVFDSVAENYSIKIKKVYQENKHLLPKKLSSNLNEAELLKWINRRKAPKNRQFVEKILSAIDDSDNPMKYVDVSHALSLNDAYWITNDIMDYKWDEFNLYSHPFDEALSYVAFTGYSQKVSGLLSSPEITSSGMLKKCWSNRNDGIYLIKGDDVFKSSDGRSQASHEFYAAQVAEAFGIEHIDYDLEEFHHRDGSKEIVCTCKLFTSENEGFVDASTFASDKGIDVHSLDMSSLLVQKQFSDWFGDFYADMMVFDSLIINRDRHLGNFGMLVDNNTGEYLRPAPLFDNGCSFLLGASQFDLKEGYTDYVSSLFCKYFDFNKQARIFVQERHILRLRKLLEFQFKKHPKYNISDETLKVMSNFVQERARKIIALYQDKIAKK